MAAITAEEVAVDLLARYDKMERQLRAAENVVDRRLGNMEGRGAAFVSRFNGLLAGVSAVALGKEFLKLADSAKAIDAQLRLATSGFGSYAQAQVDVQRLSAATRGELSATANLYGNFIRASQESGRSQEQAARATETFSKALKIGGADAAATASATLQFSQALASGVLRGDEFNSIMEASPRVARLLADGLGVPIGQLRKMAEEGKITRDVLFRALTDTKFTKGIDDEFKTLPVTFSDAMQQVENAAVTTFGAFDRGGEFSTALASFITEGSTGFKGLATDAEQMGVDIRATLAGLYDAFNPMLEGARSAFELLGGDSRSLVEQVRGDISFILGAIDRFSNLGNGIETSLVNGLNRAIDRAGGGKHFAEPGPASDLQGRFDRGFDSRQQAGRQAALRRAFGAEGAFRLNTPDGRRILSATPPRVSPPAADPAGTKRKGPSADTLARRAEAQRQKGLRNDEAFANEKAGLNQDLLRARRSAATAADIVAQFELQEIGVARDRQNSSYQRDVAEKKLTQARADELIAINNQVAAARAAQVQAERDERARADRAAVFQADLGNARDLASIDVDLATTTRARRDAALRLLDVEFQLERSRLDAVLASKESTEAEREIARRRLATLPQIESSGRAGVNQQYAGPVGQYTSRLRASVGDMDEALEGVAANGLATVEDGLTSIVTRTQSVGDAFKQMADRIIADLIRIAVQKAILAAVGGSDDAGFGAAPAGGGGGGGVAGFLGTLFGTAARSVGGRASGGYVGPGQTVRVNEQRPGVELLRMGPQGGTVIPLGQAAAARPTAATVVHQHFSLDARGAMTTQQFVAGLKGYVDQRAAEAGQGAYRQSMRDAPGAVARRQTLGTPPSF